MTPALYLSVTLPTSYVVTLGCEIYELHSKYHSFKYIFKTRPQWEITLFVNSVNQINLLEFIFLFIALCMFTSYILLGHIYLVRLKASRRYVKSSLRGRNVSFYAKFPLNLPPVTKRPLDSPEKNGFIPVALIETIWIFYCLIFQTFRIRTENWAHYLIHLDPMLMYADSFQYTSIFPKNIWFLTLKNRVSYL